MSDLFQCPLMSHIPFAPAPLYYDFDSAALWLSKSVGVLSASAGLRGLLCDLTGQATPVRSNHLLQCRRLDYQ